MRKGLNFRQKIILSHILLFLVFSLFAFPFIEKTVSRIVFNNLEMNSFNLLHRIQKAKDEEQLIALLKESEGFFFFRVSLFDSNGTTLYDSSRGELTADGQKPKTNLTRAEVEEALQKKIVFLVGESSLLAAKLAYVEIAFDVNGR